MNVVLVCFLVSDMGLTSPLTHENTNFLGINTFTQCCVVLALFEEIEVFFAPQNRSSLEKIVLIFAILTVIRGTRLLLVGTFFSVDYSSS